MNIITNIISAARVAFGYCPRGWCVCEKTGNVAPIESGAIQPLNSAWKPRLR